MEKLIKDKLYTSAAIWNFLQTHHNAIVEQCKGEGPKPEVAVKDGLEAMLGALLMYN